MVFIKLLNLSWSLYDFMHNLTTNVILNTLCRIVEQNMVKRELGDQMINSWLSRFLGFFIHFVGFSFAEAFINDFGKNNTRNYFLML